MSLFSVLLWVCGGYVALLFLVAYLADRAADRGRYGWLRSSTVYTLSLSIYCTAWTFYGAVGYAARSGLEFVTIYLGPTLVLVGWWWILRKLVRIARTQRITSIADLISSRFGKSNALGVCVTLLAVIGTTPYIALQLQSITLSLDVFTEQSGNWEVSASGTALWSAAGLALFTVIFGTRKIDVNERHHGVVTAIAVEAVVKLVALLAVGVFVVWGLAGGVGAMMARIAQSPIGQWEVSGGRWAGLTFLSAAAFLCLPRMFQVLVVENQDERHLRTAAWAFPLYLMLMSLFVVPIAVAGLEFAPAGINPDLFVLALPLSQEQGGLALLAFLGGFSSATAMVVVASIALSTMVSNHIVMPVWLAVTRRGAAMSGDARRLLLISRRISIGAILAMGYLYFHLSGGGEALARIGLVSFTGVVQLLPVLLGGIFWLGATRSGAFAGVITGFIVWLYTLFLPSLGPGSLYSETFLAEGPFGMGWARPQALFGLEGVDPLFHTLFWSLTLNGAAFVVVSLLTSADALERLQAARFVNIFQGSGVAPRWTGGGAQSQELMVMAQRILGTDEALALFRKEARRQGREGFLPEPGPEFLERLERALAGNVGAATAHAMIARIAGGVDVSFEDLLAVADETARIREYSERLEQKSAELERTARELQEVNRKLTRLSVQKDAFLSQISHELRTPMTSIRAFSDILREAQDLSPEERSRAAGIIHDEAVRLTRLLDDLLDLSVLESGQVSLNIDDGRLSQVIERAVAAAATGEDGSSIKVIFDARSADAMIRTDLDRLAQVFINIISNARKYCDAAQPELRITVGHLGGRIHVDFTDNGSGVPPEARDLIFEKFSRAGDQRDAGGAGLGLAISRQIMARLGGAIEYLPDRKGAAFRVTLPAGGLSAVA